MASKGRQAELAPVQTSLAGSTHAADTCCCWLRRCEGLANELSQILHAFKESLSSQGRWEQMSGMLEPMVRSKLQQVYML
jgi:hypothetical protein